LALVEDAKRIPGAQVLADSFTAVQQSIGCLPGNAEAANFLQAFVGKAIDSGFVTDLIKKHDVVGKLSVASPFKA